MTGKRVLLAHRRRDVTASVVYAHDGRKTWRWRWRVRIDGYPYGGQAESAGEALRMVADTFGNRREEWRDHAA